MEIKLLGLTTKEAIEEQIKIPAAAGKLSRFDGDAIGVYESSYDFEDNVKWIERITKMGHKSIIDHDYLVLAIKDVTPILEQTIIGKRLTSFTVKSRREVNFSNAGFYVPEFRDKYYDEHPEKEELTERYNEHMNSLFSNYQDYVDMGLKKEDARYVLPYSFYSNIIMGLDAHELESILQELENGNLKNVTEAQEFRKALLEIVKVRCPYMLKNLAKKNSYDNLDYLDELVDEKFLNPDIIEAVKLVDCSRNIDDKILISALQRRYQLSFEDASNLLEELSRKDVNFKSNMMKNIFLNAKNRELEQVDFTFNIPISLAVLTHLTRHRMHSLLVPDFLPMWDLEHKYISDEIKNKTDINLYNYIFRNNKEVFEFFKEQGVVEDDLIYFYLAGNMCNVSTTMNGRTVSHILRMRECEKAQKEIRDIAHAMNYEISKQKSAVNFKDNIGTTCEVFGYCPEGRECCGKIKTLKR